MMTSPLTLAKALIVGEELVFEQGTDLRQALHDGCFRLLIPADLDVSPGIRLCRSFYRPTSPGLGVGARYDGFKGVEGVYFDREHFQTEHVLADRPARQRHFPDDVCLMCDHMTRIALLVLRASLTELGIPKRLWDKITGGAVSGSGTQWFAGSHYRPERDQLGCAPHKDTGFVTVLYTEQDGLEALAEDGWRSINAEAGYFIINFGGAFELLTESLTRPVQAILHRVRQCKPDPSGEDRFSFAAFANPPATGSLYRVRSDHTAEATLSVEEFLRDFNKNTWNDRYDDFGIIGPDENGAPQRTAVR
jgi:hypothetical protein